MNQYQWVYTFYFKSQHGDKVYQIQSDHFFPALKYAQGLLKTECLLGIVPHSDWAMIRSARKRLDKNDSNSIVLPE